MLRRQFDRPVDPQNVAVCCRFRLVEMTGKFDLVITSHLLEDITDPVVPERQFSAWS